jgi:polysaccharide export outer membrane protein
LALALWPVATRLPAQTGGPSQQQAEQQKGITGESLRPNYTLGPGDQIMIHANEMEEVGQRPYLIDGDGNINVPTLGSVKASGLTIPQLEAQLVTLLRKYVQHPEVTVTVSAFRAEPVFFEGAFLHPGIQLLQGQRTLIEMIATIGGTAPNASRYITVVRRKEMGPIPLPNAVTSPDGSVSTVTISMASLRNDINPAENIVLQPYDTVRAERAEFIYVNGAIGRVGGLDLNEKDSMSVTQVITLAGGLKSEADPTKAVVLRPVMNTSRRSEIPLNLDRIMRGKDTDFPLLPNDLLYIPQKGGFKANLGKALLIIVPLGLTLAVLASRL